MSGAKWDVLLDEPETHLVVETDARDRRAFERDGMAQLKLKGELKAAILSQPETYTAWLVWHALRRSKAVDDSWPAFEARLVSITSDEDEDEGGDELGDPTRSGATPD